MTTFTKYLTKGEQDLIQETKPKNLAELDEDALSDLHNRVRRARSKYSKLHRREASATVRAHGTRVKASTKNVRSAAKAEAFEDALARVSRALASAARQSAAELKAERLAAARREPSPAAAKRAAPRTGANKRATATPKGRAASKRNPSSKKKVAATRAVGARRQAKRDGR